MNRLEPLQPVFDFYAVPQSVNLLGGTVELNLGDDDRYAGTGEVLLQFLPSPRVVISAKFSDGSHFPIDWVFNDASEQSLFFSGEPIEGFLGRRKVSADGVELEWVPSTLPLNVGDMTAETTVAAISHVFNFPDFRGGKHQEAAAPEGCALLLLESEDWQLNLQSLPEGVTQGACKRIKEEGGCFLTHVAKLERKDGNPFSGEVAQEQFHIFSRFLSFVVGRSFWFVCGIGLNASGDRTWTTFAAPRATKWVQSWFHEWRAHQAEELFPLFARRWQQSREWQDCLNHASYWYTQANTNGSDLGIDSAIILIQVALERLAYHHLVIDRKMISSQGLDGLKVSDRLRMLFSSLNIPADIPDAAPEIKKKAIQYKWADSPYALTDIRNELVHPVKKKEVGSCFVDAWRLGLWYLELSILALCGYDGVYQNRMRPTPYPAQLRRVPWRKNGSEV